MKVPLFENIFREYYKKLCTIAYRKLGDFQIAQDIVQELFMELWKRKTDFSVIENLPNYLRRSISLKCIDHIKASLKNDQDTISLDDFDIMDDSFLEKEPSNDIRLDKLKQRIKQLPPKCRAVFTLSRFDNMTYAEIASELDISIKSVEKHISKALHKLRER